MKNTHTLAVLLLAATTLAACKQPETPAKTEADVMRATAEGQAKVTEAATEAVTEHIENAADAREEGKALSTSELKQDVDNLHKVDTTAADARLKIAQERCDALAGDAKATCLKEADTIHQIELGQAKAEQKSAKTAIEQNARPQ